MRLQVYTSAYTTDPEQWRCIRESAAILKVSLIVHGIGRGYTHIHSLDEICEIMATNPADYSLLTDGYDTFFARWDENEVIELIENEPGKILMAGEDWCWPDGPWAAAYAEKPTPWYAINGGGMCGRREELIRHLRCCVHDYTDSAGGGSQERYHKMYADGIHMGIDTDCRVFQCMHGTHTDKVLLLHDPGGHVEIFNSVTQSNPMIIHFNGRAPGLHSWFDRWKAAQ